MSERNRLRSECWRRAMALARNARATAVADFGHFVLGRKHQD